MALPKLNAGPSYQMVIPSTREKINYRPFLVKEEKNLMIAMESNDPKSTILTLLDTIKSCVSEPLSVDALTSFDMEYMFLQIRSKTISLRDDMMAVRCLLSSGVEDVWVPRLVTF